MSEGGGRLEPLCLADLGGECGSALRSLGAARAPGLRARLGLRSPRVPSSFARAELRCSRRPERRGRAVLGGPGGGRPSSSRGRARHRHSAEPPGGFPAPRPGRPNNLALCSPRAPPPRLCSGFGARPPAAAQTPPGPTRHPGSVSPTCAGLPRPELYAQVGVRPGVKCEDLGPEHVAGGWVLRAPDCLALRGNARSRAPPAQQLLRVGFRTRARKR